MVKKPSVSSMDVICKSGRGQPGPSKLDNPRYPLPAARYPQRHNRLCFSGKRAAGNLR